MNFYFGMGGTPISLRQKLRMQRERMQCAGLWPVVSNVLNSYTFLFSAAAAERSALGLVFLFRRGTVDIDLRCGAALFFVILTVTGFTAHMNGRTGNTGTVRHFIPSSCHKALTAGFFRLTRFFSSDCDISFAAVFSSVVDTAHCRTN